MNSPDNRKPKKPRRTQQEVTTESLFPLTPFITRDEDFSLEDERFLAWAGILPFWAESPRG